MITPSKLNHKALKESGDYLLPLEHHDVETDPVKCPHPANGQASLDYILKAIELVTHQQVDPVRKSPNKGKDAHHSSNDNILKLSNGVDALVTGPVSKQAINLAGHLPPKRDSDAGTTWATSFGTFQGHTEFFAQKTKARKVVMMFVQKSLRVALVTRHLAYKKVPLHLNTENILSTIILVDTALKQYFGFFHPRIGVCALNPHAGENGLFGREETTIIKPALELATRQKIVALGPYPADSIFRKAIAGELDAVVALYHDQALIPIKTLGYEAVEDRILSFNPAVNVTLGLPFIRTSVAHGTAFDIAGQNRAHPDSMINAIKLAYQMSLNQPELF